MTYRSSQRTTILRAALAGWGALAACATSGCESDKPVQCRYVGQTALAESPVTQLPAAALLPAADGFVLAGMDAATVHWAALSKAGMVGPAATFAITETTVLPPQLAVSARAAAGDQLVAVYGVASEENQILIRAVTQVAGEAARAPITLATLPAGLNAADVRLAVGSSKTGLRALVAFGWTSDPTAKVQLRVLQGDAVAVGEPLEVDPVDPWRCLQFVPSRTDWALAWLRTPVGGPQRLALHEGQDGGFVSTRYAIGVSTPDITCPTIGPKDRGYVIAFQNTSGTFIADYSIDSTNVSAEFVTPGVRFGTPDQQPQLAGVAAMGFDSAVMFGLPRGPQVWLYDPFGARVGKELKLPANVGSAGRVGTWPVDGGIYATYREGVGASPSAGPRWFMRVECPRP